MAKGIILVNGAGGFLGSTLVESLCREAYQVRATDLPGTNLAPARKAGAEVREADLLDAGALPRLFDGVTAVANVAGLFNYALPPEVLDKANVQVTRNMCEAALSAKVARFVHISSIAVYGRPQTAPMTEAHPRNAANNYEKSKRQGEDVVLAYAHKGLPAVTLRPAGIYGPRSRYGQAAFMALLSLYRNSGRRKIPVMKGGPKMQHVHVADVAGAVAAALAAPGDKVIGRAFNVGDDTPLGQGELFLALMPELDLEPLFSYPYFTRLYWPFIRAGLALPEKTFERLNDSLKRRWDKVIEARQLKPELAPRLDRDFLGYMSGDYVLDSSALKSIGWQLKYPDSRIGLAETVRWYQAEAWLPRFLKA